MMWDLYCYEVSLSAHKAIAFVDDFKYAYTN